MSIWEKIGRRIFISGIALSIEASPGDHLPGDTIAGTVTVRGGHRHWRIQWLFVHLLCRWRAEWNVIRQGPQLPFDEVARYFQIRAGMEIAHSARYETRDNEGAVPVAGKIIARDLSAHPGENLPLPFELTIPAEVIKLRYAVSWELLARGVVRSARDISAIGKVSVILGSTSTSLSVNSTTEGSDCLSSS